VRSINVGQTDPGWRPVRLLVEDMLAQPQPPTALFVDNSFISLPLLYPLPSDGGRLPPHIAALDVVHFEDWPLDPVEDIVSGKLFATPRNATVLAIDWETIGRLAARMLVDQVRGTSKASPSAIRVTPILQQLTGAARAPADEHPMEGASA
jgi:DNA-binding LacI/PurR family transcriptional regulator